jgi:hypothetical protein
MDIPGPLITSFRNGKQLIPEHFDPINLLIINCDFLNCLHNSVLQSARNSLVKPPGISTLSLICLSHSTDLSCLFAIADFFKTSDTDF